MSERDIRKIPFNYTSADDGQVLRLLLGDDGYIRLQKSRLLKTTGFAQHALMRFFGDMFMLWRNPFVRNDLILSPAHHQHFFKAAREDVALAMQSVADTQQAGPVMKSSDPPTPMASRTAGSAARLRAIHLSCRGAP